MMVRLFLVIFDNTEVGLVTAFVPVDGGCDTGALCRLFPVKGVLVGVAYQFDAVDGGSGWDV